MTSIDSNHPHSSADNFKRALGQLTPFYPSRREKRFTSFEVLDNLNGMVIITEDLEVESSSEMIPQGIQYLSDDFRRGYLTDDGRLTCLAGYLGRRMSIVHYSARWYVTSLELISRKSRATEMDSTLLAAALSRIPLTSVREEAIRHIIEKQLQTFSFRDFLIFLHACHEAARPRTGEKLLIELTI